MILEKIKSQLKHAMKKSEKENVLAVRNILEKIKNVQVDYKEELSEDQIIFSTGTSLFSYNENTGNSNWKNDVSSIDAPIIDGKNIFIVTSNGYLVILDKETGKIISSSNILNILKKKKKNTKITNFIMGSDKIYSITLNGYMIVSSALSGKSESYKKIGGSNISPAIINNGKLYILTDKYKILELN